MVAYGANMMTYTTTEELYEELSLLIGHYIDLVHEYYTVDKIRVVDHPYTAPSTVEIWLKSITTGGDYKMTPREFFHSAKVVVRKQE